MTKQKSERCETCHGIGQVGELFHDETIPFPQGEQCPDCGGKGFRAITTPPIPDSVREKWQSIGKNYNLAEAEIDMMLNELWAIANRDKD